MKFLNNLDLNNNQLLNAKLHFLAKPTSGYVEGRLGYDSAVKRPWWMHDTAAYYLYPFDNANTANTGVLRDASGNFSAGTITASLAGTASTATTLQTNRNFSMSGKATANAVAFNGSADVVLNVTALAVAPTEISGASGSQVLSASAGTPTWTNRATIPLSDWGTAAANLNLGGFKVTNSAIVTAADAPSTLATKGYVDTVAQGLKGKTSVRWTTTGNVTLSGLGTQAGGEWQNRITSVAVNAGGTGYVVGDVLTVQGGTYAVQAVLRVTSVSAGAVTGVSVQEEGNYSVTPTNPAAVTGGSGSGATFTITWVVLEDSERILVKNQTLASENGIYEAHSGAWNRAPDADSWDELVAAFVFVEMGVVYADTGWLCTVDSEGYLGDPVNWTQFSAAGVILAGNGLVKSGNYLHFATASNYTVNQIPITTGATTIGFLANGSANQVLRVPAGGGAPGFGSLDLAASGTVGSTILGLANGGTNASLTASAGGVLWTNATQMQVLAGTATANKPLLSGASASPSWWACTLPAAPAGANRLLYADTTSTTNWTNSANSALLVTNGSGVPSFATDIPTAVTIGGSYVYRVGGTDVSLADGGTGASLTAVNGGLVWSSSTALQILAAGTSGYFLQCGGAGAPSWVQFVPTTAGGLGASCPPTAGNLLSGNGATWTTLAIGSAGKLLRSTGTAPAWSTITMPDSVAVNTLLYASSADVLAALATSNKATLTTDASGVPTWETGTDYQVLRMTVAGKAQFGSISLNQAAAVSGVLQPGNGGTGSAYFSVAGPTAARTYTVPDMSATLTQKKTFLLGTPATSYTVAHGMGPADIVVLCIANSANNGNNTGDIVYPDLRVDSTNIYVTFSVAPAAANDYRLVVVG
jgi:hypothetical protein